LRGNRILVVDDEPNIVRSLAFVFNKEGYDVSIAEDGAQAMTMIRKSKPDILILDVMMPNKSGYDVCREVKSDPELQNIHVFMLTAKGQKGDREDALSQGADEYISKPFSPIQVLARVKELLS
jgi:two-component system alkaline phosphatase synthesis response regulator PhoP